MAENSLFAVLLRSRWWISFAVAAAVAGLALTLLPDRFQAVGALSSLPFIVIGVMALQRQWNLPSATQVAQAQQTLTTMAWPQFAALLEDGLRRDGYTVRRGTGATIDFELERAGRRGVLSAKRWKSAHTGLDTLRALQVARDDAAAADAIYVCLGDLTKEARPFATKHRITIWQAAELARILRGKLPRATPSA